jgi:hypothetical protein
MTVEPGPDPFSLPEPGEDAGASPPPADEAWREPPGVRFAEAPSIADESSGVPEVDLLAASLRADRVEGATFLQVLGMKLAEALPDLVRVEYEQKLLRRTGRVRKVEAALGEWVFELEMVAGRLVARVAHVVRGMRLRTDETSPEEWAARLAAELRRLAERSAAARDAIARLLR